MHTNGHRPKSLEVDLLTDAYRISGRVEPGRAGLLPELNGPNSDFIALEGVYVSRLQRPGEIIANYTQAFFRKDNVGFLVLQDRRALAAATLGTSRPAAGQAQPVFLTVPSFEISGHLVQEGRFATENLLVMTPGRFQPVFDARAVAANFPELVFTGDLILVNKDRIAMFCLTSVRDKMNRYG